MNEEVKQKDSSTNKQNVFKEDVEVKEVGNNLPMAGFKEPITPISLATTANTNDVFQEVAVAVQSLNNINTLAEHLIKGKLCPHKNPSDVTIAILTGKQYGFPFMTSINNIFAINGKSAMSTHLHRALVLSKGIYFNKIEDYSPIYQFAKGIKTEKGIVPELDENKKPIILKIGTLKEAPKEVHIVGKNPLDYITTYEFEREIVSLSGVIKTIKTKSSYSLKEASTAGLLEKDNWKNYPARMLDARAFAFGSREIASDILLGVYTISELGDTFNRNYTINDNLEEQVVDE